MQVLYKLAPSWEGVWAGFGPARQAGRAQRPVFEKMFFGHYWGLHGSVSGIQNGYQGFSAVRFWPRGSGNTGIHQEAEKKHPPGHGNHGPKAKNLEKGSIPDEIGH